MNYDVGDIIKSTITGRLMMVLEVNKCYDGNIYQIIYLKDWSRTATNAYNTFLVQKGKK